MDASRYHCSIVRISALFVFLLLLSSSICKAQVDEPWTLLDANLQSDLTFDRFYFENNLRGYTEGAITTDGGRTWGPDDGGPIPRFTDGDVAVGFDGSITFDGGKTWRLMSPENADTLLNVSLTYGGRAASARHFAALFLGSQLFSEPFGVIGDYRIAWTNDGGSSWEMADSVGLVDNGSGMQYVLLPRDGFGPFPGTAPTRWTFIGDYIDTTHLVVVRSTVDTVREPEYYLGLIDLKTRKARWSTLPLWRKLPSNFADQTVRLRAFSSGILIAHDYANPDSLYYWRSMDTGATWEPIASSQYFDVRNARFINDTHWVDVNGYTVDGGVTWTPWSGRGKFLLHNRAGDGYGYGPSFYPVDTNRFLIGEGPMVALSTDRGETWERNAPAFAIRGMIARDGRIIESRGKHATRFSTDNGESWTDRGANYGELPDKLNMITALAWYDTAHAPDNAFATAIFVPDTAAPYVAAIETTDGGRTWSVLGTIAGLNPRSSSGTTLQFVPATTGEGMIGFVNDPAGLFRSVDDGRSWERVLAWEGLRNVTVLMTDGLHGVSAALDSVTYVLRTTEDGGQTWSPVELPIVIERLLHSPSLIGTEHLRIPILAADSSVYLVSSDNRGASWRTRMLPDAPVIAGQWVWLDTAHLFVNSNGRLHYSADGGESFEVVQNFPVISQDIFNRYPALVGRDGRYLYFDLNPLGIGRRLITPDSLAGIEVLADRKEGLALHEVTTMDGTIRFRYVAESSSPLVAELFDVTGRKIAGKKIEGGEGISGVAELRAGDLPSGNYLLRLIGHDGKSATGLIRIAR